MPPKGWKKAARKQTEEEEVRALPEISRLEFLRAEAEMVADKTGHDLDPWEEEDGWAWALCSRCKGRIAIAEHPPKGSPSVQPDFRMQKACA